MRAVTAEVEDASGQDVVADEGNGVAVGVPFPIAGPLPRYECPLEALMLEAGAESWLFEIAVEGPAIGERMHLFAGLAPMKIAILPAPENAAYLSHCRRLHFGTVAVPLFPPSFAATSPAPPLNAVTPSKTCCTFPVLNPLYARYAPIATGAKPRSVVWILRIEF